MAFVSAGTIYLTRPSAIGAPEPLYRSPNPKLPNDWSPDGRFLIFNELHPTRRADLYALRIEDREPIPLVVTDADEWPAIFSPDGKWIAYSSDETGTREVYVRDFASGPRTSRGLRQDSSLHERRRQASLAPGWDGAVLHFA